MMSQSMDSECLLPNSAPSPEVLPRPLGTTHDVGEACGAETSEQLHPLRRMATSHSSVLVVENEQLVGIFTERDLVRLTATQADLRGMNVADVMTKQLHTLVLSAEQTIISALNILQQYKIRHLPVIDTQGMLLGIITPDHIRQILQPTDLLKFRSVGEGMTADVIHTTANTTILQVSQLMVEYGISSIVIVDGEQPLRPVGIITEKDVLQFQVLELDLTQLSAESVMSSPLFCLQPADSLWSAQQVMESRRIRRLVVTGAQGELQGIVTQSNLLRSFDPLEMLRVVDSLQMQLIDRSTELEQTNQELRAEVARRQQVEDELRQAAQGLEQRVVDRSTEITLLNEQQQSCNIALEISQQGISDFIENAIIGMNWVEFRADKLGQPAGIIVWANQAELKMLGYDRKEYIGQPLIDFYLDREAMRSMFQRLLNNELIQEHEAQMRRKDGSICHVLIDANALFKDGKFIHARFFTRDITDRKNAEAVLQETLTSLEFQKYALDRSAIVAITDQQGKIVYVNDKFCQISQYSAAELMGKTHFVINSGYHPPEFFRNLWTVITSGEVWSGEIKNRAKDGSYYWVATTIVPLLDDSGQPFQYLSIRFNITDRKQMEAALQASKARYRALVRSAPVGIYQTDVAGNCLFINQRCLQLLGITKAEALGQSWISSLHPDDREWVSTQWYRAVQAGQEFKSEHRFVTPQGRVNWVFVKAIGIYDKGVVTGYIGTLTDITERKQLEREREQFLAVASDLQLILGSNGYFHWVSPNCESTLGWTSDEMTSHQWTEFLHPDDIDRSVSDATSLFFGQGTIACENRYRHKDGSYRWLSWKAQSHAEEQVIYAVAMDITEKKQLEQQFLRAQRLESLGTLASGIAHDLNNVLTPIQGVAQLLPRTLPNLDERNQRLLTMLVESSKRGSSLVKQILTFARGLDGQRAVLQVRHILAEIINVARQTFPKAIEIVLDIAAEDLWMVNVDATQIHQVLMNLFVNARDAMPNGGRITATAGNIVIDETAAKMPSNTRAGSYVAIMVADTGMGIDSGSINKIFDPFFTTKKTGTGLGLSTVSGIIKAHGGFINVDSEIDRGTCFTIYLPAITNSEEDQPIDRPQLWEGNGQLILVVDDEDSVREITKSSLETYNYRVILARDGVEAIVLYAQHLDEISVVMLDMMMPNLDTPSVILALQRIKPTVKIVAMSGSVANEQIVEQFGLSAFLTKPFTMIEVLNTLVNLH